MDAINEELLIGLAYKFNIDSRRYTPVKIESSPFFALYCIDKVESVVEGREWITRFDLMTANRRELEKLFGTTTFDFAVSEKYQSIAADEGNTIDFSDQED